VNGIKITQWDPGIMKNHKQLVHSGKPLGKVDPMPSEGTQCVPAYTTTCQREVEILVPDMTNNAEYNNLTATHLTQRMLTCGAHVNNQTGETTRPSLVEGGLHDLILHKAFDIVGGELLINICPDNPLAGIQTTYRIDNSPDTSTGASAITVRTGNSDISSTRTGTDTFDPPIMLFEKAQ